MAAFEPCVIHGVEEPFQYARWEGHAYSASITSWIFGSVPRCVPPGRRRARSEHPRAL